MMKYSEAMHGPNKAKWDKAVAKWRASTDDKHFVWQSSWKGEGTLQPNNVKILTTSENPNTQVCEKNLKYLAVSLNF